MKDPAYLANVRQLPCLVTGGNKKQGYKSAWACDGPIEAHHAGKNPGLGMKAPDDTAVPLCRKHHRMITGIVGGYGIFDAWGPEGRREMQDNWIRDTQRRLAPF